MTFGGQTVVFFCVRRGSPAGRIFFRVNAPMLFTLSAMETSFSFRQPAKASSGREVTPFLIVVFTFACAHSLEKNIARMPAVKSNNKLEL